MTSAGNLIFGISAENHLRHRTGIMWSSHIYAIHSGIYFVIYFCWLNDFELLRFVFICSEICMSTFTGSRCRSKSMYNRASLVRNCLHHKGLQCLVDCCITSIVTSRWHLHSASHHHLVVPRHSLSSYGHWAFVVAGAAGWNLWVTNCTILCSALTVSEVYWIVLCFHSSNTLSALQVLHIVCYINLQLAYLLTKWFITYSFILLDVIAVMYRVGDAEWGYSVFY